MRMHHNFLADISQKPLDLDFEAIKAEATVLKETIEACKKSEPLIGATVEGKSAAILKAMPVCAERIELLSQQFNEKVGSLKSFVEGLRKMHDMMHDTITT